MGLASEPNVGDNGVHASASPFEALCERLNWKPQRQYERVPNSSCCNGTTALAAVLHSLSLRLLHLDLPLLTGAKLEEDAFGKAMLDAGIPKETIMHWTKDPQSKRVAFHSSKSACCGLHEKECTVRLGFGLPSRIGPGDGVLLKAPLRAHILGRLNRAITCLSKAQAIAGVSRKIPEGKMQAFVFVKPHAVTDATLSLVSKKFEDVGISIKAEADLTADVIEKDKLIDNHYYAIANKVCRVLECVHVNGWGSML
eukprot:scaffold118892_cov32-Tisochrysis_lutea.AAC.2